ncbi:MAG: J domain-containing protein [Candidatus Thiodiazotropha sp.]
MNVETIKVIGELFLYTLCFVGLIIALGVVGKVLKWLAEVVATGCNRLIDTLSAAIIRGLQRMLRSSLQWLQLTYSALSAPTKRLAAEWAQAGQEGLKLWQLYWEYGREEFRSFRSFARYMRGEGDDREEQEQEEENQERRRTPPPEPPPDTYKEALQLLGFSEAEELTRAMLKQRHRELIRLVHPDKGCPSPKLAQQINDAVKVIKQRRNWK